MVWLNEKIFLDLKLLFKYNIKADMYENKILGNIELKS